jgi:chromate transporter
VVIALVLAAMLKIGGRALKSPAHWALAAAAFTGLYLFGLPFPLIVALAAASGLALGKDDPGQQATPATGPGLWRHSATVAGVTALLAGAVFLAVSLMLGLDPYQDVAELFTTAAFVTFGGAYAVLPFVAENAVGKYGWLDAAQMLNGLAIRQALPPPRWPPSTPSPLRSC